MFELALVSFVVVAVVVVVLRCCCGVEFANVLLDVDVV